MDQHRTARVTAIIGALLTWTAVILQFSLSLQHRIRPVPEVVVQFFSYYTILTNILVACCFTAVAVRHTSIQRHFLSNAGVLAATTVYIIVVGSIYNLLLRALWTPTGVQVLVDELLHTFIPLYYVVFWLAIAPKVRLRWHYVFLWLLYPLGYFLFTLIRGAYSGFYPYPFIDVTELGWPRVFVNSGLIAGVFVMLSLLIILFSNIRSRNHGSDPSQSLSA